MTRWQLEDLGIQAMATEAHQTSTANGWHQGYGVGGPDNPYVKLAALGLILRGFGRAVEAVRKGESGNLRVALSDIARVALDMAALERADMSIGFAAGPHQAAFDQGLHDVDPVVRIARAVLIASEVAELIEAILAGDLANEMEEHGDIAIRVGDATEIMRVSGMPVDLVAAVREKMARNKTRGHRHGGKRA